MARTNTADKLNSRLADVLGRLPDVERLVLEHRTGLADGYPKTLADTARDLNLGRTETAEIEARAFERIRNVIPAEQLKRLLPNK